MFLPGKTAMRPPSPGVSFLVRRPGRRLEPARAASSDHEDIGEAIHGVFIGYRRSIQLPWSGSSASVAAAGRVSAFDQDHCTESTTALVTLKPTALPARRSSTTA